MDEFAYGPDGERYARKTVWKEGGTTKQEHVSYIGNTEYITYVNDPTMLATYKTRIGDNIMHIWSIGPNQYFDPYSSQYPYNEPYLMSETIEYAHRDHLGGVESVTDQYGNKLQQLAYEPFGSRKDSDWRQNIDLTELNNLLQNYLIFDYASFPYLYPYEPVPTVAHHARVARGFTGHEHLDRTGFIHMNGRVYDPELGRFLSPDPIVQAPTNSQNWNRYSYVLNNPLSFTDPSGFAFEGGFGDVGDWAIQCGPGLVAVPLPGSSWAYMCIYEGEATIPGRDGYSYFDWPESDPWFDDPWYNDTPWHYGGGIFIPPVPPSTPETPVKAQPSGSESNGKHHSDKWSEATLKHQNSVVWGTGFIASVGEGGGLAKLELTLRTDAYSLEGKWIGYREFTVESVGLAGQDWGVSPVGVINFTVVFDGPSLENQSLEKAFNNHLISISGTTISLGYGVTIGQLTIGDYKASFGISGVTGIDFGYFSGIGKSKLTGEPTLIIGY